MLLRPKSGAFTGENSAEVAKSLGSHFVLLGHSERRVIFKEQNEILNQKALLVESLDLVPVFCVGETLDQRQENKILEICFLQFTAGLKKIDKTRRLIVAYEPVWAIGTGQVTTPKQVAEVHSKLHRYLQTEGFKNFQLLYGDSVKPDNSAELLKLPFVDGFLIGGAALQVESFIKICGP